MRELLRKMNFLYCTLYIKKEPNMERNCKSKLKWWPKINREQLRVRIAPSCYIYDRKPTAVWQSNIQFLYGFRVWMT